MKQSKGTLLISLGIPILIVAFWLYCDSTEYDYCPNKLSPPTAPVSKKPKKPVPPLHEREQDWEYNPNAF